MEPIKPSDKLRLLAAQPDTEAELAEHEQLLAERFLHDPDASVPQAAPELDDLVLDGVSAVAGPELALDDASRRGAVRDALRSTARRDAEPGRIQAEADRRAQREDRLRALHDKLYGPPRSR
jgi:hypothetical protein